jgi:hypothetical protein
VRQWLRRWLRLPGWPQVPRLLWLTLGGLLFCLTNLLFAKELWPHVSRANEFFSLGIWLLFIVLWPQLLGVAWRWLRSWQGPALLRWLATAVFLAGACVSGMVWLVCGLGGLGAVLRGQDQVWLR